MLPSNDTSRRPGKFSDKPAERKKIQLSFVCFLPVNRITDAILTNKTRLAEKYTAEKSWENAQV